MKIIIIGGGRTGYHLAKHIPRSIIIEKDPEKLERLRELIGVHTILGDAADEDVLLKAGIRDADVMIIVTADDKINYQVASTAKKYGVKNIISRVENPDNEEKFRGLEIGAILCPTKVLADYIKAFIHPKTAKEFFLKKVLVPVIGPETLEEAFEEALQIAVRTNAQLILIGTKKEYLGEEKRMLSLLDVPANTFIEEGDMVAGIEKHIKGADLLVVDPEELTYFEKILKKSLVKKMLEEFITPILISRTRKAYEKVLLVTDASDATHSSFKMTRLFGEIYTSSIDIVDVSPEESENLKEEKEALKIHAETNGFHTKELEVEGNMNIEVIKLVKSGEYDLIVLPWGDSTTLKNDVVEGIINEAPGSVLLIKG